jgi:hypothetical protein
LGIARDGSAAAHGDHLEADLDEVAKLLADAMKFSISMPRRSFKPIPSPRSTSTR